MLDSFNEYPASLAARIAQIEAARALVTSELNSILENEAVGKQPAPGKWSPAEIAYHLHLVERGIGRMLQKSLSPAAAGARHERRSEEDLRAEWERVSRLASPDYFPVEAPAPVTPQNAPPLRECVALLAESRRSLLDTLATATLDDLASFSRPHLIEAMGVLTGAGWVSLIAFHELRHVEQMRRPRI